MPGVGGVGAAIAITAAVAAGTCGGTCTDDVADDGACGSGGGNGGGNSGDAPFMPDVVLLLVALTIACFCTASRCSIVNL
jgi:hypothetical protein